MITLTLHDVINDSNNSFVISKQGKCVSITHLNTTVIAIHVCLSVYSHRARPATRRLCCHSVAPTYNNSALWLVLWCLGEYSYGSVMSVPASLPCLVGSKLGSHVYIYRS